jgi:hypothetical protein
MRVSLFSWALLLCWDGTAALGQTIVDTAVRNNGKARVVVENQLSRGDAGPSRG